MDFTIAPPGRIPLRRRRFVLVDVPDLALLPIALPNLRSVFARAGIETRLQQQALTALA